MRNWLNIRRRDDVIETVAYDVKPGEGSRYGLSQRLQIALLGLTALFAFSYALILPPFQANDEHAHFVRAYEIANGKWVGTGAPALPIKVIALISSYPEFLETFEKVEGTRPAGNLFRAQWNNSPSQEGNGLLTDDDPNHKYLRWGIMGSRLYSPIAYAPSAAAIWILRDFVKHPILLVYAARCANTIVFLACLGLAFALAADFQCLLACIGLLPMTIVQASVISADSVTISISIICFALLMSTRKRNAKPAILVAIALLFPVWAVCKPAPWIFGAVLLVARGPFVSNLSRWRYIGLVWAAMLLAVVGWQSLSARNTADLKESRREIGIDVNANLAYAQTYPINFAGILIRQIVHNPSEYLRQFWGVFGWTKFSGPWWLRWSYLVLLFVVAGVESIAIPLPASERIWSVLIFLSAIVFIHGVILLTDGQPCDTIAGRLCFQLSAGVQGRYFIPFCLFGLVVLKNHRWNLTQEALARIIIPLASIQGAIVLWVVFRRFYS